MASIMLNEAEMDELLRQWDDEEMLYQEFELI
ncbi:hypothetical protein JOD25_001753 [Kurthia huakuii]|nr:hypothetical protein [Kurthia huakuii]